MVIVEDFEALMEAAAFFAKAPAPRARGVAVVATSGGAGIMAADKAELYGIPLPQPAPSVREVLEQHIPEFGSTRNPCDVTAQVVNNPKSLWACAEALMSDASYGAIVMPQPVAFDFHKPRIAALSELSHRFGKITCNVLVSNWLQGPRGLGRKRIRTSRCFAPWTAVSPRWRPGRFVPSGGRLALHRTVGLTSRETAVAAEAILGR